MNYRDNNKRKSNHRVLDLEGFVEAAALLDVRGRIWKYNSAWRQKFATGNFFKQLETTLIPEETIAKFIEYCRDPKQKQCWKLQWSAQEDFLATASPAEGDGRRILLLLLPNAGQVETNANQDEIANAIFKNSPNSFSHNGHPKTTPTVHCLTSQSRPGYQVQTSQGPVWGPASQGSDSNYELVGLTQSPLGQEWKEMRKLSSQLQATLGAEPVALATYCLEGLVLFWNSRAEEIYGWSESELFEKPAPFSRNHFRSVLSCLQDGCGPLNSVVSRNRKDGSQVKVNQSLCPLFDAQRSLIGVLEFSQEVVGSLPTQSRLNLELIESREAERASLAREMHDGPLQELMSIGFCCSEVERELDAAHPDVIKSELQHLRDSVLQVGRSLREVIRRLRPGQVEELGLAVSLEEFIGRSSRDLGETPKIRLDLEDQPYLTSAQGLCLFRIAQEAFHNCLRHAQARNITIKLWRNSTQVALEICDDGQGFVVPSNIRDMSESEHYGLLGMNERSKLLGASFHLESTLGQGTRVRVSINLDRPDFRDRAI